jgi:predicted Zn finger-like uncharacterized protein
MKISCQSCQAKYTIADEKVLGKVVKIRCKKCGSTIVINGNEAAPKEDSETAVFDYTSQSANEQWTVNVADGDQRTLTVADIVREYRAGVINEETYCWKDGMSDWLPVRDIEQFQQALASGGEMRPSLTFEDSGAGGFAPASVRPGSVRPAPEDQFAPSSRNGNGGLFGESAAAAAPAAAAARRAGGRGGGGADLFGGVAHAGGEEDVMTSAPTAAAAAAAAADASRDDKLTGQRNENSVLFSLAALTDDKGPGNGKGPGTSENKTSAQGDGSGLIDIRALSANMAGGGDGGEKNRVDDIMNLSGGGAFGAALAAPILAPPPMEVSAMDQGGGQSKGSNKGLMLGLLGGGAFLAIALVAVAVIVVGAKKTDGTGTATGPGSASTSTTASTGSGGALAAADPTGTSTGIAPSTTDTAAPPSVGTAGGKGATAAAGTAKAPGTSTAGALVAKNDPPPAPGPAAPEPKPTAKAGPASLAEAMATAAGTKPAPAETAAASGGGAFDRGAAAAAIGAVNVASCKKPDGPTGSGHAFITFGPDGSVKTVEVDGGPYPGTPVGGCIAGKFRSARVPAFSGSPVRVGKSFTIN